MVRTLALLIAVAGCKSVPTDWSDKPLVAQTLSFGDYAYTLDIPDGLPKDDRTKGDWSNAKMEYDHVPKVFTSVYPLEMPKTPDEAKHECLLRPDKATIVRNEQRPDGWAVTSAPPDKKRIEVGTLKKIGTRIIQCRAIQDTESELPSYDKTKAMLEKICDSVREK